MSENKFIKHLRGENTAKSVLEIKNQRTTTSFGNMPEGTSNANDVYSDHRGNATGVLKGSENWKLDGQGLVETTTVYGDGRDLTSDYEASGNGLWVDATVAFATARRFNANTKFVLKLCGHDLETVINHTVDFTLIVKFGTSNLISKTFTVTEQAFDFCKEFVIDFAESNSSTIKADAGSTMQVQLLCADANARATIYDGMTVFTALQRRVDGEAVASDTKTFPEIEQDIDDINDEIDQIHEDIDDLEDYVDDTFVRLDGESIMTGPLKMRATSSFQCAIAPYWDGVGFYKLNSDNSVTLMASIEYNSGFEPSTTNTYNIGALTRKWKNLYLSGKAYISTINNGYDLAVPAKSGTLATMGDVDLAANSGDQLTEKGVWYAKMYSATVAPSAEDGTNYADFSQTDNQGNPIIVIYKRQNGAWVQDQTITPPAEYNGYVPVTSKIWDIVEQAGQQGGKVLWAHSQKTFTPSPLIISFEDAALTGVPTAPTPTNSSPNDQIANKEYVDNATANSGSGLNVGDIFLTMRNDNELNGAVECDGSTYNTTDFTGAQSIGDLLADGKVPYVSMATYATEISTKGWCDKFGWDGTGNIQFKVPTLSAYIWQKLQTGVVGNGMTMGITDGNGNYLGLNGARGGQIEELGGRTNAYGKTLPYSEGGGVGQTIAGNSYGITTDPTKSGMVAGSASDISQQRCMVQLATSATDEALETCTSVLTDVATLKGYDYVVDFQAPTAQNNYTWYRKYKSGWVEQGGIVLDSEAGNYTVNLPVAMADTNYDIQLTCKQDANGALAYYMNQTTTSFVREATNRGGTTAGRETKWRVEGMAA